MKRTFLLFLFSLIGAIFYCILMEGFHYINLIIGFVISFFGAIILIDGITGRLSIKTIWQYVKYSIKLIYSIYKSSIIVIKGIFSKSNDVEFIEKECDKEISPVAFANAITLSPGTVTVDKDNNTLIVVSFDEKSSGEK